MANGTYDEKIARADRIKEQSLKSQRTAELNKRATMNTIASLREDTRSLPVYREEMDSVSEVTVNWGPMKAHVKALPPWMLGAAIIILTIAAAIVLVMRVR